MTSDKDPKNQTRNQYFCKADSQDITALYKLKAEMELKNAQKINPKQASTKEVNLNSKEIKK